MTTLPSWRVWSAAGRDVVPRAELESKLARDPELFLVAEDRGEVVAAAMGTHDGRRCIRQTMQVLGNAVVGASNSYATAFLFLAGAEEKIGRWVDVVQPIQSGRGRGL